MNLGQECWVGLTFNRLQKTSHKTIPIDTENRFDKIQHLFMTATLGTLGIEETSLNLIKKKKKLYRKTTANVTPYTKTLDSIPMKSGARQE